MMVDSESTFPLIFGPISSVLRKPTTGILICLTAVNL